jgi:cytochrome P450
VVVQIRFRGLFGSDRLLVTNPKMIAEVLVTKAYDLQKPSALSELCRKFIGTGLITAEGDEHKRLRKDSSPAFSFRRVKDLYPVFWDVSAQFTNGVAQQLTKEEASSVIEINHWANLATTDIIGMAAMGKDFGSLRQGQDHPLIANFEEITNPSTEKVIYFALNILGLSQIVRLLPWRMNKLADAISTNLYSICSKLVSEKQTEIAAAKPDAHKDILSHLITTTTLTHQQLVDQFLTILSAGHGTTSVTFTWLTYLLAQNPEIQRRLRSEIHQFVPSPSKPVNGDDLASILQGLPLLNGVCNETLRLYPAINIIYRNTVRPTVLAGNAIPAGVQVILSPWAINRDKRFWGDDGEEFRPERWIDIDPETGVERPNNSGGSESNYANLTFLHGPRSCIGHNFAVAELRCLVAMFVGRFEFEMADPDEVVIP